MIPKNITYFKDQSDNSKKKKKKLYPKNFTFKYILTQNAFTRVNPLSANPIKLPMNCLSVFDNIVGLALQELSKSFTTSSVNTYQIVLH